MVHYIMSNYLMSYFVTHCISKYGIVWYYVISCCVILRHITLPYYLINAYNYIALVLCCSVLYDICACVCVCVSVCLWLSMHLWCLQCALQSIAKVQQPRWDSSSGRSLRKPCKIHRLWTLGRQGVERTDGTIKQNDGLFEENQERPTEQHAVIGKHLRETNVWTVLCMLQFLTCYPASAL